MAAEGNRTYLYNGSGTDALSPDAYTFLKSVPLADANKKSASNPQDLMITKNGMCYVLDTDNNRLLIYDKNFSLRKVLETFTDSDGNALTLNKPEGIYAEEDGTILIADTQNNRVLRSDSNGKVSRIILKPQDMTGTSESDVFYPVKVATDDTGRIYVVARNLNMGIVTMTAEGKFMGYIGAPKVQYSLTEMLWRQISTQEQKDKMVKYVPTEYSNIAIDSEGFLYGTISSLNADDIKGVVETKDTSGSIAAVRKLNSAGSDVLKRNGQYPPIGDLIFDTTPSRMEDVTLSDNGVYSLLDSTKGRIFTYDENGNLLFAFGGNGQQKQDTQRPSAIGYLDNQIVVLDSMRSELFIYSVTEYGKLLLNAVSAQFNGDFDSAYRQWSEITENNINMEYAFVGLGNAYMMEKDYEAAMECFEYASDKENYSKAKTLLRKQQMKVYFPVLFTVLIVLLVLAILKGWIQRFVRYYKKIS